MRARDSQPRAARAASASAPPAPLVPAGANPQGADAGAVFVGAPGAPTAQQALLVAPPDTGLFGPAACDAPHPVVDSGSGRDASAVRGAAPTLVSAAGLVASGASLTFHPYGAVVVSPPSLPPAALPSPWPLGELAVVGIGAAPRRRSRWWAPAEEPFVPPPPPVLPAALNMLTLDERARLLLLRRHRSRAVRTFMERSLGC